MPEEKFTFFWSGPFSQWYPSPFTIDGITYNCAEQFMMAEKARLFKDDETLARIMSAVDPSDQKRYGRQVKNFDLNIWNDKARDTVYKGSMAKYLQNSDLKKILLDTAVTTLVEASPEDKIWGIGLNKKDPRAQNRDTWLGSNWLGETLTKVREDIIYAEQHRKKTFDEDKQVRDQARNQSMCENFRRVFGKQNSNNKESE